MIPKSLALWWIVNPGETELRDRPELCLCFVLGLSIAMCTAGLAAGCLFGKLNGQNLTRSDGLKWHRYTASKDPGRTDPLVWVALKDKGRAVPDDIACKNAWKALGKGLPGELSASTIKKVLELGRRNAAARAYGTSASTSASASASASASIPPASTISAPTAVKGKGKRLAAEEKTAASDALASIGFDRSGRFTSSHWLRRKR